MLRCDGDLVVEIIVEFDNKVIVSKWVVLIFILYVFVLNFVGLVELYYYSVDLIKN